MKYSGLLPESFLRCLSAEDRKSLGKGGQTEEETLLKAKIRNEKELQRVCLGLLTLRGIVFDVSRMDKRKTDVVGWPDATFAVTGHDGYQARIWSVAIEFKLPGETLSQAQRIMRKSMTSPPNAWTCRTITSAAEMKMFLEGLGL